MCRVDSYDHGPANANTGADGLALALLASALAIVISFYTFDAYSYRILMGVLFVNFGLISTRSGDCMYRQTEWSSCQSRALG